MLSVLAQNQKDLLSAKTPGFDDLQSPPINPPALRLAMNSVNNQTHMPNRAAKSKTKGARGYAAAIGSFKRGGKVPKTGIYKLHKDEVVVPAKKSKKSGLKSPAKPIPFERGI